MNNRFAITLCVCGQPFQGNFKKHNDRPGHEKKKRCYFCATCNRIGEEGHDFKRFHKTCDNVSLPKVDLLLILNGESPKDLVMKVKEAKEKKEARALRREAKKVAAMLEKEEREKKAAMEVAEKEEKASTEEEDREEKKKEQIE